MLCAIVSFRRTCRIKDTEFTENKKGTSSREGKTAFMHNIMHVVDDDESKKKSETRGQGQRLDGTKHVVSDRRGKKCINKAT